jgi:hypothetical protein
MANIKMKIKQKNGGSYDILRPETEVDQISDLTIGLKDFLKDPSSTKLATAVTGETGSGALVFGTSPTLDNAVITNGINISSGSIVFEGSTADDFETSLTVVNPTTDNTITLPNLSGTTILASDLGTSGYVLQSNGPSSIPTWKDVSAGFNVATANNLSNTTAGAIPYQNGTGTSFIKAASNGEVLVSSGTSGSAVAWALPSTLTVGAATNATNINISATTSSDTTTSIVLVGNQSTGNQSPFISSSLLYNASTGLLSATGFSGSGALLTNIPAGQLSGTIPSGVLGQSSLFIGTTQVLLNRASGALTLAGISLTTPDIGAATATSINKVAITAPATSATLTIANGKTFIVNNNITLTGTDGVQINLGSTNGTLGSAAFTASTAYEPAISTLSIAKGGTNGSATPTLGAVAYGTGTAYAFSNVGTSGQVLTSAGNGAPTWTSTTGTGNIVRASNPTLGGATFTGTVGLPSGSAALPAINFISGSTNDSSGFYREAQGSLAISIVGTAKLRIESNNVNVGTELRNATAFSTVALSGYRALVVNPTGDNFSFGSTASSIRFKDEVQSFSFDKNNFLSLEPKKYKMKKEKEIFGGSAKYSIGFIAEQAQDLGLDFLYQVDEKGIPDYFAYDRLPIYLFAVIKEQEERIKALEAKIQ